MNPYSKARWIFAVVAGLILALIIIIAATAGSSNPRGWLRDHYPYADNTVTTDPDIGTVTFASDDTFDQTVAAVVNGTDPTEQMAMPYTSALDPITGLPAEVTSGTLGQAVFLRYEADWLVAIIDEGAGVRIELDSFDNGYNRHGTYVGGWGSYYGRGGGLFRGGGSGYGK